MFESLGKWIYSSMGKFGYQAEDQETFANTEESH